jgi:transcription elongation factor GreB
MSKAFVSEQADPEWADEAPTPKKAPGKADHITPEGYRALQRELDRLWSEERPRLTEEVAAAAAQGDRSENAEYIYGKKRLREIDRRIRYLGRRLESVTVVHEPATDRQRIYFGAWFTIEDDEGERASYRIVGTDEHDLSRRFISEKSPLAKALLGKRADDVALVVRPRGPTEVVVIEVWYEP